eukprot:COSAG01_NODE_3430_length_6105_cov_6.934565_3_plen_77_part_00
MPATGGVTEILVSVRVMYQLLAYKERPHVLPHELYRSRDRSTGLGLVGVGQLTLVTEGGQSARPVPLARDCVQAPW